MVLEFANPFDKATKRYSYNAESFLIFCISENMAFEFKIVCNHHNIVFHDVLMMFLNKIEMNVSKISLVPYLKKLFFLLLHEHIYRNFNFQNLLILRLRFQFSFRQARNLIICLLSESIEETDPLFHQNNDNNICFLTAVRQLVSVPQCILVNSSIKM